MEIINASKNKVLYMYMYKIKYKHTYTHTIVLYQRTNLRMIPHII